MTCDDCGASSWSRQLLLCTGDTGRGAWLAILCETCEHRRYYRYALERRRDARRAGQQTPLYTSEIQEP